MNTIALTPSPPFYAVIFTSVRAPNENGYPATAGRMLELARLQEGFLGFESAREDLGISVSYWKDLESIRKWKEHSEHILAQKDGREKWYLAYRIRIAKVEREYGM